MKSHCDYRKKPQRPNNIPTSIEMPNLEKGGNKGFSIYLILLVASQKKKISTAGESWLEFNKGCLSANRCFFF